MKPPFLHHITLTVSGLARSAEFYQRLFGPADVAAREGPGWQRRRLLWPGGLMIGVTVFDDGDADGFDPSRIGMDHVGFGVDSAEDVRGWVRRMDDLGIEHGPVEDTPHALVVTGRDPDGIPIEFYWAKPPVT
jgi:catechol 2,3-dioxygenase-like lactoylglutathione lyase family enzyme